MNYVLYVYGSVVLAAVYGAVWTVGGPGARMVLSLGTYAYHPSYEPPSRRWRRSQLHRRDRAHDFQGWHDFFAQAADAPSNTASLSTATTAILPIVPGPTLMPRAEMTEADSGAEHWGDLLGAMRTEERTIFSAEMAEAYETTKAVERPALHSLDAAVAAFTAALAEQEQRESAAFEGTWHNLYEAHGGRHRWQTGQYEQIRPTLVSV